MACSSAGRFPWTSEMKAQRVICGPKAVSYPTGPDLAYDKGRGEQADPGTSGAAPRGEGQQARRKGLSMAVARVKTGKSLRSFIEWLREQRPSDLVEVKRRVRPDQFEVTAILEHLDREHRYPA